MTSFIDLWQYLNFYSPTPEVGNAIHVVQEMENESHLSESCATRTPLLLTDDDHHEQVDPTIEISDTVHVEDENHAFEVGGSGAAGTCHPLIDDDPHYAYNPEPTSLSLEASSVGLFDSFFLLLFVFCFVLS